MATTLDWTTEIPSTCSRKTFANLPLFSRHLYFLRSSRKYVVDFNIAARQVGKHVDSDIVARQVGIVGRNIIISAIHYSTSHLTPVCVI